MLDSAFVHHPHMSKYLDEDFLFSHSSKTPETCWANMKRHRSAISGTALSMLHIDFLKTLIAVKNSRGDFLAVKGSFVLVMPDWKMKCSWELVCREFFTGIETNWFSDVPVFPFQLKKISDDWCTDARTHTHRLDLTLMATLAGSVEFVFGKYDSYDWLEVKSVCLRDSGKRLSLFPFSLSCLYMKEYMCRYLNRCL